MKVQPDRPGERLLEELARLTDRIRSLPLAALSRPDGDGRVCTDAVRDVAQRLADLAAGLSGDDVRALPHLADAAAADQLAVTGADLMAALAGRADHAAVGEARNALAELRGWL